MKNIDYRKQLGSCYKPSPRNVEVVEVPEMNFLMIDGEGDPNQSKSFADAIEALFSLSYRLKFMVKERLRINYSVLPLEGVFSADDPAAFSSGKKDAWKWTLMVMQPDVVTRAMVEQAMKEVGEKKALASLSLIRFGAFREGKAAQIMHIGPFSAEGPTIEKVHSFIEQNHARMRGKHHEIYLSDIRRAAPEKWKTIVRQPMS